MAGKIVLRFGMMEGEAKVTAESAVYDPQSPDEPVPFSANGSRADKLAMVLNGRELEVFAGGHGSEADLVSALREKENASVVIVKRGAEGAHVYENGVKLGTVPAFETTKVYKIGSGDAFSAAFANYWGIRSHPPFVAAEYASRTAAMYCQTRLPSLHNEDTLRSLNPVSKKKAGKVYLAGPFFSTGDLWLIEEILFRLEGLGVNVFSPFHDVGAGKVRDVAQADLAGLEGCSAVLAVISGGDYGTLFEVGYATSNRIPVVALYENPKPTDFTMLEGTGCEIVTDLATAIYKAAWASWK